MKIPSKEKVEEYAQLKANSQPNPATYFNGIMECYNKFLKPLQNEYEYCPYCGGKIIDGNITVMELINLRDKKRGLSNE